MVICDDHYIHVGGIGIEFLSLTDSRIYKSTEIVIDGLPDLVRFSQFQHHQLKIAVSNLKDLHMTP